MRVADYIAQFIYERGTKHVFMFSGGGIMNLVDGLAGNKNLKKICVHHEQTASMAIESYSRLTGKMGVGYFTTGPGITNAITGLAGAWLDSVPCLFISGQTKRKNSVYMARIPGLRQIGDQEINTLPIVQSLTKYSVFIDNPEDIKYHLQKAYYFANEGRPGPVVLDVPADVQGAIIDPKKLREFKPPKERTEKSGPQMQKIIELIKHSKRPVILAGRGVRISGAIDVLLEFVEMYKIPIVTTYLGIDTINDSHPCYTGRMGTKGTRPGNFAVQNSDLLIVIGSSLPIAETGFEYDKFAREAKIVVVDIDVSSHKKKTIKIDLLINKDAKKFIQELSGTLKKEWLGFDENWLKICIDWKKKYPACLPEYRKSNTEKINYYYFVDKLSEKLKSGDVVVTDAGSAIFAGSQAIKIKKGVRYITSGGLATMGYSLPASIGASVGLEGKRVMCITGDGSFQLNIQELQTLIHYKLPVKIFVVNNDGYLSIRFTQGKYFKRLLGTDSTSGVSFPNNEKISKAYGIKFFRAKNNKELDVALNKTLKYNGPVLCEIMALRQQAILSTASEKKSDGTMVSKPLEDMFPFLDREEFKKNMLIKPIEE
jgi:acetolactate synthase-1/2/3 large subunit